MLLVLDVGNTNIVLGVFKDNKLIRDWRLSTQITRTADEYGIKVMNLLRYSEVSRKEIDGVIISSVVPNINYSLDKMIKKYFGIEPMFIGPGIKTGLNIKYKNPKEVGADIIVTNVAAYEKYRRTIIVVDFGTATTYCAVTKNGDYLGGSISPGIKISAEALTSRAAKLSDVELVKPKSTIGQTTENAMQSGVLFGYVGAVEYIVNRMKKELMERGEDEAFVVATGGFSYLIGGCTDVIDVIEPYLILDGLNIIYKKNEGEEKSENKKP